MLEGLKEIKPWVSNKQIDCIRVNGTSDEGPVHLEDQFLWKELQRQREKLCTLVTKRKSGGSCLNKVELMNGCLLIAHSTVTFTSHQHYMVQTSLLKDCIL